MATQAAFAALGIESMPFAEGEVIRIQQAQPKGKRPPRRRMALEMLRSGRASLN
jgi:hypothetical protein